MSTRTALRPQVVINAGDMSGNLTSTPTILSSMSMASYSLSWIGTAPVGTASVQVSNDYSLNAAGQVENGGTWTTLVLSVNGSPSTTVPVSGASGSAFIDINQTAAYAVRLVYTSASGSGALTATIAGKVQ
jgi:hypothetical protein